MSKKEFIARLYYIMSVETGNHFVLSDLSIVLNCDLSLDEFETWLNEQEERLAFNNWLFKNELDMFW